MYTLELCAQMGMEVCIVWFDDFSKWGASGTCAIKSNKQSKS